MGSVVIDGEPGCRVVVCTAEPGVLPSTPGGFDVVIRHGLDVLDAADAVIVPSTGSRTDADPVTLNALRAAQSPHGVPASPV